MAKTFLTSVNLAQNELQNAVLHSLATAPSTPKDGQIYYNSSTKRPMYWNNTAWSLFGHTDAEIKALAITSPLTGLPTATNSVIGATDTILNAFSKLQGQITAIPRGTVTSVGMTVPTGLSVTGSPITSSGTFAVTFASGYSIPTTAKQTNWDDAYNDRITAVAFTGTTAKTITLTQGDGGTLTAEFTDNNTTYTAGAGLKLTTTAFAIDTAYANSWTAQQTFGATTGIKIGNAILKYDATNNALYVEGLTAGSAMNFYATGEVSAYGVGSGTGGGGGVTALSLLSDVSLTTPTSGNVLIYNGTHWENKPQSTLVPDLSSYATQTYVNTAVANLVASSPATLDTLNELAAALGNDPSFATTVSTQIGTKVTANAAITAGTATKITYDAKGLVTAGAALAATDIPNLDVAKITTGVFSVTRGGTGVGTITGLVKGNGTSAMSAAVAGTDYVTPSGSITGNAGTATKLATARAFSIGGSTGLTAAAINFNGEANVALSLSGTLATANGGTGLTDAKGGFTRKVIGTFTTAETSYVITHGIGTDVIAQVVTASAPFDVVECDIEMTSTTTTTFRFNVAPAANAYRYIIIG